MTDSQQGPAQSTRERIMGSAVELFSRRGTSSVSMRDLAASAGVSVQGLYYHFSSKDDLIRAVRDLTTELPSAHPDLPARVADRITVQGLAEFELFRANVALNSMLTFEVLRRDQDALKAMQLRHEMSVERWAQTVLAPAVDIRPDADLHGAATFITTSLLGINITYMDTFDASLAERIRLLGQFIGPALAVPATPR
jgi:TetR/AcrR family transcriptional regulator, repressor for uid operon